MPYDRNIPFNDLPLLPPAEEKLNDFDIYKKLTGARAALGKLDGIVLTLPNPSMLINVIALREAKDSSAIENIFTSNDELYQALVIEGKEMPASAKEVLTYREALSTGFDTMKVDNRISMQTVLAIFQRIQNTTQGIRPPGITTVIKKGGSSMTSGQIIYTPPRGNGVLEAKMQNWLDYCNDDEKYPLDPLLKMAITHYQFEAIHPFPDGNGRTGRILNLLLLSQKGLLNYPVLYLSGFIIRNKSDYYEKIGGVTERFAWKQWIMFILEGVEQTCYYTIQLIEDINRLYEEIRNEVLKQHPKFNHEIIKLLFFQPYIKAVTLVGNPLCDIASRQTADKKLQQLVEMNMISKKEVGKETVYINHHLITLLSEE